MTEQHTLETWRELVDVTRLIAAVQAVQAQPGAAPEWQAGLAALEQRRTVLAYVLSLEDPAQLEAVYARLVEELRTAGPALSANLPHGARLH